MLKVLFPLIAFFAVSFYSSIAQSTGAKKKKELKIWLGDESDSYCILEYFNSYPKYLGKGIESFQFINPAEILVTSSSQKGTGTLNNNTERYHTNDRQRLKVHFLKRTYVEGKEKIQVKKNSSRLALRGQYPWEFESAFYCHADGNLYVKVRAFEAPQGSNDPTYSSKFTQKDQSFIAVFQRSDKRKFKFKERLNFPNHPNLRHPSLSDDGRVLLFASNAPGNSDNDDFDLYFSVKKNETFQPPEKIRGPFSTDQDEIYPFLYGRRLFYSCRENHLEDFDIYSGYFNPADTTDTLSPELQSEDTKYGKVEWLSSEKHDLNFFYSSSYGGSILQKPSGGNSSEGEIIFLNTRFYPDESFGKWYALLIVVDNYKTYKTSSSQKQPDQFDLLESVKELKSTLVGQYYFDQNNIIDVYDSTNAGIINSFKRMGSLMGGDKVKKKNLLIVYAGHSFLETTEKNKPDADKYGVWAGTDTEQDISNCIPHIRIKDEITKLAPFHTLILNFSCDASRLSSKWNSSPSQGLPGNDEKSKYFATVGSLDLSRKSLEIYYPKVGNPSNLEVEQSKKTISAINKVLDNHYPGLFFSFNLKSLIDTNSDLYPKIIGGPPPKPDSRKGSIINGYFPFNKRPN